MEHKAWCVDCYYSRDVTNSRNRWMLPQECKEVANILLKMGFSLEDFCFCLRLGELRSLVVEMMCDYYIEDKKG